MPMEDIWDQAIGAGAPAGGGGEENYLEHLDHLFNAALADGEHIYGLIDEAARLANLQVTLSWIQAMQIFV